MRVSKVLQSVIITLALLLFVPFRGSSQTGPPVIVSQTPVPIVSPANAASLTIVQTNGTSTPYSVYTPTQQLLSNQTAGATYTLMSPPGTPFRTGQAIGFLSIPVGTASFTITGGGAGGTCGDATHSCELTISNNGTVLARSNVEIMSSGGGISGTGSSPFLPYFSSADTVSNSKFAYDSAGTTPACQGFGEDGLYSIDSDDSAEVCLSPLALQFSGLMDAGPAANYGVNGLTMADAAFNTVVSLSNGALSLGNASAMLSGSFTLNGATTGSVGLAPGASDSSLVMTQGGLNTFNFFTDPMGSGLCQYSGNANCINEKFTVMGSGAAFEIGESGATFVDCASDSCPVGESFQTTYGDGGFTAVQAGGMPGTDMNFGISGDNTATFNLGENGVTGTFILGGTTGAVTQQTQSAAGTPTITWGTSTGTPAVTASSPLAINAATGNITFSNATITTATNCANGAAPAVCGSAAAGHVAVPTGSNPTLVVNTSAVTANSEILLTVDESSTISGITCNTTLSTLPAPVVIARTAGTSFTVQVNATLLGTQACIGYEIVN